jgi:hydroxymethylbilane synthase
MKNIVIATRGSKLALWQANHIKDCLQERYPGLEVDLKVIKTRGDKILDVPLAKVGGKGLFVKEIEEALQAGDADIAVHSMKDVPSELPDGLKLGIIPEREVHTDSLLSVDFTGLDGLPEGAHVGTSSLRRQAQLLRLRPDLRITSLRGNLDTRVRKLEEGQYDAIVVAAAGMTRLGLKTAQMSDLTPPDFYPALAQGALGIEYAEDRSDLDELLGFLDHAQTRACVLAERAFLFGLDGGCQVPIAGEAILDGNMVTLTGVVGDVDGTGFVTRQQSAKVKDVETMGRELAREVLDAGAREILERLYGEC